MEENKKQVSEDIEFVTIEPEVKEFVRKSGDNKKSAEKTLKRKRQKRLAGGLPDWAAPAGYGLLLLIVILCGILLCKAPAVMVILVCILEVLLVACLCESPVWLHVLVVLLNVVLGIIFHVTVFMILTCVIYLAGIWLLHVRNGK